MSKYTTELRYICETSAGLEESEGSNKINAILTKAMPKIFDFEYPIFDEAYRRVLERKILRHYYTREICEETVGLWKLRLEDRLNIIMPYYNQLYKSTLLEFNPLYDVDLTIKRDNVRDENSTDNSAYNSTENFEKNREKKETADSTANESGTGNESGNRTENNSSKQIGSENSNEKVNASSNENSWNLFSDTPQGGINGINNAYSPNLSNESYLTDARNINTNNTSQSNSENNSNNFKSGEDKNESEYDNNSEYTKEQEVKKTNDITDTENNTSTKESENNKTREARNIEDYLEKVTGKRGGKSYASLLTEFRNTFLNIDNMVIDELEDLFMCIW